MDLGKLAQDTLGQALGGNTAPVSKKKAKTTASTDALSGIEDSVDAALKSKLPKGTATDIAENVLDQNKDGHIVDDLLRMGESLLGKKK